MNKGNLTVGELQDFQNQVERLETLQENLHIIDVACTQMDDPKISRSIKWFFDNFSDTSKDCIKRNSNHEIALCQSNDYPEYHKDEMIYVEDNNEKNSSVYYDYFIKSLNKNIKIILGDMKDMMEKDKESREKDLQEMTKKITGDTMKDIS